MSARTIIETAERFYDSQSLWLHGSRAEFSQFKLRGRSGWDAGGIFLVKDTLAQGAYAKTYGEIIYRCRVNLAPDEVFELPVQDHVDRAAEIATEDAIGNDFLRSAFESQRYGHVDWAVLDQEVLELAGFKGCVLAERPKGFNNFTEDILSLCVFDPGAIEILGRVTESARGLVEAEGDIVFKPSRNYGEFSPKYQDVDVPGVPQDPMNYFTVKHLGARRLEITSLGIPAAQQGQGYGRRAVQALEAWARANRIKSIHLEALEDAVGFWEKMGFEKSRARASESDWVRMTKVLE